MAHTTRRDFLRTGLAATAFAGLGGFPAHAQRRSATDWVTLGKTGVKVTRLAFGTGTFSGRVQRELGQEGFNQLVRYAYDHGIRFFETAESYSGMGPMLGTALKGLPRDSYRLMTKMMTRPGVDVSAKLDSLRKDLNTEYLDIILMHCVRNPTWPDDFKPIQDGLSEAKSKKVVMAHGASVHGLPGLRAFPGNKWLDLALFRVNHNGTRMDAETTRETNDIGNVDEVAATIKKVHAEGKGVLGMKLCGEGQFTRREDRQAALKFAFGTGAVDAVTIGYKSPAEIDEAIENLNLALNG
jgi:aryl-alcohol dehydrogenase-like predicted oxidoreductase